MKLVEYHTSTILCIKTHTKNTEGDVALGASSGGAEARYTILLDIKLHVPACIPEIRGIHR